MSRRLLCAIAATTVAIAVSVETAPVPATTACGKRAGTIIRTSEVKVYRTRKHVYYACDRRTNRTMRLGRDHGDPDTSTLGAFYPQGARVAWEERNSGRGGRYSRVGLADLTRRTRRMFQATTPTVGTEDTFAPDGVTMLIVTASGAVAWIADDAKADPPRIEVHKADAAGRTLLDAGFVIRRGSLRATDDTLTWVNGTETRTATARGTPP